MEVIDNKDFILESIRRHANEKIKKLESEFQEEVTNHKKLAQDKFKLQKNFLLDQHKKEQERIKKQRSSSSELVNNQKLLAKQSRLYERVIERVEHLLQKGTEAEKTRVFKAMIAQINDNVKSYKVPKGVKIDKKNVDASLDELKVIGVISDEEEMEISIVDLIKAHQVKIHDLIVKELFP